jgi:hypothetical protein
LNCFIRDLIKFHFVLIATCAVGFYEMLGFHLNSFDDTLEFPNDMKKDKEKEGNILFVAIKFLLIII